jgi:hypothetical protein
MNRRLRALQYGAATVAAVSVILWVGPFVDSLSARVVSAAGLVLGMTAFAVLEFAQRRQQRRHPRD